MTSSPRLLSWWRHSRGHVGDDEIPEAMEGGWRHSRGHGGDDVIFEAMTVMTSFSRPLSDDFILKSIEVAAVGQQILLLNISLIFYDVKKKKFHAS